MNNLAKRLREPLNGLVRQVVLRLGGRYRLRDLSHEVSHASLDSRARTTWSNFNVRSTSLLSLRRVFEPLYCRTTEIGACSSLVATISFSGGSPFTDLGFGGSVTLLILNHGIHRIQNPEESCMSYQIVPTFEQPSRSGRVPEATRDLSARSAGIGWRAVGSSTGSAERGRSACPGCVARCCLEPVGEPQLNTCQ